MSKKKKKKHKRFYPAVQKDKSHQLAQPTDQQIQIQSSQRAIEIPYAYDEHLLDRARTQWQFGDWDSLASLDRETIQHHPDKAKLALLAAAGNIQKGNYNEAKLLLINAKKWGCDKKLIAQILVSGVYNTLGRVATIANKENKALEFFKNAVKGAGGDEKLIGKIHTSIELGRVRLKLNNIDKTILSPNSKSDNTGLTYDPNAYAFYVKISEIYKEKDIAPFILLDSKSLPRSGLHYMKNTFSMILENHFSFCEWYQEVGCCKKMPCALTGYAEYSSKKEYSRLRLVKSHDFELSDPDYDPVFSARRLILIRNPLFMLTSFFTLDCFNFFKEDLKNNSISINKIFLSHEPEILSSAFRILDDKFNGFEKDYLIKWLEDKTKYTIGFLKKWILPYSNTSKKYFYIVRYEVINEFICKILSELISKLPVENQKRANKFIKSGCNFSKRDDPFLVPSKKISDYLKENVCLFKEATESILEADKSGYLKSHYSL